VDSHRKNKKHERSLNLNESNGTQQFLTISNHGEEIIRAFLDADIPLFKLRNHAIKNLFKHLNVTIPSEGQARRLFNKQRLKNLKI
jgi:hypothetical protein